MYENNQLIHAESMKEIISNLPSGGSSSEGGVQRLHGLK